jgi:uncharacterized protein YydD (DUF2326 family)
VIHRIFSDLPSFKNLEFWPGLNILLADRAQSGTDLQTRNRAGKSSLIQIIHFLMGSSARPESLFRRNQLENWKFGIEVDLPSDRVVALRSGRDSGRIAIQGGSTAEWPIQPSQHRGNSLSTTDWRAVLGERLLGSP